MAMQLSGEQYQAPDTGKSPLAGEQYQLPKVSLDTQYDKAPRASGSMDLGGGVSVEGSYQRRPVGAPDDFSARVKFKKEF